MGSRAQPSAAVHAAEKLKVGFIYIGPVGDLGWTYQHDLGSKAMEKALGDKIETTYIENVPESADAERSIEQLVRTGHKLIFATSFGFMEPPSRSRTNIRMYSLSTAPATSGPRT